MLLKIVYLLTCRVLGVAVLVFRGDRAKATELLVLRHENAVLRRHIGRIRYEPADRVWFAALARLLPRRRWTEIFPVTPATLLAWHRKLAATKWVSLEVRRGLIGRLWCGLCGSLADAREVDGAGGVEGFLGGAGAEPGEQGGFLVAVAGGGVDGEAEGMG